VKRAIRSASILKAGRAVFNIAGNKYRIVCGSIIPIGSSMSGFIGTHRQYEGSTPKPFESGVMDIAPIKTRHDHRNALKEIEGLMTARRNTPEGDRLDVLVNWSKPGSGSIIGSIFRTRWKRSSIIWTRMDFSTARPYSLHRQPQPGARGPQSQALPQ